MDLSAAQTETIETLSEQIGALVAERQTLRAEGASEHVLERNRVTIAQLQRRLSGALIARYAIAATAA